MTTTEETEESARRETAARLAWSPAGLRVPPDLAVDVVARRSLSISSASAIRSCPARWAAEKLFPTGASAFDPTVVGTAGHDVLEQLYSLPGVERTQDRAAVLLDELADRAVDDRRGEQALPELANRAVRLRWVSAIWAGIVGLWEIEDPAAVDVWAVEYPVADVAVGGVPFGGFVDRIDRVVDKNGVPALRLIDYKTGRYRSAADRRRFGDDHGDQLRLYAEAVETVLADLPAEHPDHGLRVVEAHDFYTKHGKSTRVALSAPYRRATVAAHAAAWTRHGELVATGHFPAKPSGLCTYCPLVRQCPFRAETIKWDKVRPTALSAAEAPILAPLGPGLEQTLRFGDDWDATLDAADPYWDALAEWPDTDETHDPAGPVRRGWEVPAAMDPFARLDEERYTAVRDPFAAPLTPPETATDSAARDGSAYGARAAPAQGPTHSIDPQSSQEVPVDDQQPRFFEDKAWNDDPLNVGSYAHLSANHLVNTALGQLRTAGVDGADLTQGLIQSTASILWNVVTTVQEQVIGHRSLQSAMSRNLLYSLDEVLALSPMPLVATRPDGTRRFATGDEISAWGVTAIARLGALVSISVSLAHQGGHLAAAADFRGTPLTGPSPPADRPQPGSGAYGAAPAAAQGQASASPAGGPASYSGPAAFQATGVASAPDDAEDPTYDPAFAY